MITLVEFLLARIAEDEAEAQEMGAEEYYAGGWSDAHTARFLAECEATKSVVALYLGFDAEARATGLSDPDYAGSVRMTRFGVELAMKALATPYAAHPDYDPEWSLT